VAQGTWNHEIITAIGTMVKAAQRRANRLHKFQMPVTRICRDGGSFGSSGMGTLPSNSILIALYVARNGPSVSVLMTPVIRSCDVPRNSEIAGLGCRTTVTADGIC